METEKKVILFGAGNFGKKALAHFGHEKVAWFADNNAALAGTLIDGVPVITFEKLKEIHRDYEIVVATGPKLLFEIVPQLEQAGIKEYRVFLKMLAEKDGDPVPQAPPPGPACGAERPAQTEYNGKRVLMIAYYFPPLSGSGVFRSLKFAKYLPQFGWMPTVISTDRPRPDWDLKDTNLLQEVPREAEVIRLPDMIGTLRQMSFSPGEESALLAFLRDILRHSGEGSAIFDSLSQDPKDRTWLLTFPCTALLWAYEAVRYIEKNVDLRRFSVVYTTSGPCSDHLVGFYLKEKYGIPWVADYRDPWTDDPLGDYDARNPHHRLYFELESILLKKADRNLIVAESAVERYIRRFSLSPESVVCITNGYDERDFDTLRFSEEQPPEFSINYSGLLYSKYRNVKPVLRAVQELAEEGSIDLRHVRFRVVGTADPGQGLETAKEYKLDSILVYTGYLPHQDALQLNYDSGLLLLLVGDGDRVKSVYTGKVFDYLRSGRPILALAPRDGVVDKVLRETGHGEAYGSAQLPEIKAMILREYQKWRRGEKRELLHSPRIERFERKRLTGQLAEVLDTVSREENK